MKRRARAFFVLATLAANCCMRTTLAEEAQSSSTGKGPQQGLGSPVSEWYLSLKTSKGYCGLVPATDAAGGYGYAIACNNKYPQYDSSFSLLLTDDGVRNAAMAADATSTAAAGLGSAAHEHNVPGSSLTDASMPVVVPSGRSIRLLARSAGLCNTPPVLRPRAVDHEPIPVPSVDKLSGTATMPYVDLWARKVDRVIRSWLIAWRCGVANALKCVRGCISDGSGGNACGDIIGDIIGDSSSSKAGGSWCRWWRAGCHWRRVESVQDVPPRAVICSLGQPSGLSYKIFKPDLKDGESVELDKEWIYLMEGDKYCTLSDVAGLSAVVSCHLDAPGWSGYKFQLQTMSYPRSQLHSLLTDSPCGVQLPGLPGPHDVECQAGEQAGRTPQVDLVLQTPGSPLVAGVVVGFSTYSPGLLGAELQRCCANAASPHIVFCEAPQPGPMANECWFQMYDVKMASLPLRESDATDAQDAGTASGNGNSATVPAGQVASDPWISDAPEPSGAGVGAFLRAFLRAFQQDMSPSGLDPDLGYESSAQDADDARATLDSDTVSSGSMSELVDEAATDPHVNDSLNKGSTNGTALLLRFLRSLQLEMSPSGLDPDLDSENDLKSSYARRLLSAAREWYSDGRRDAQPIVLLKRLDGAYAAAGVNGTGAAATDSIAGAGGLRDGTQGDRQAPRSGAATGDGDEAAAGDAVATAAEQPSGFLIMRHLEELGAWAASSWRFNSGVSAAAPLADGSLVMLLSRAFSRYCSVSLDGTLLCVSAQASNASRNLFRLFMPPMPPMPVAAAAVAP